MHLTYASKPHGTVQTWVVDAYDGESYIGTMEFARIDLAEHKDPHHVLDEIDVDLGAIAAKIAGRAMPFGTRILIMNRVELATAWRGRGIGANLAALAISELSADCDAVFCYPAPVGDDRPRNSDPRWQVAAQRLAGVWAQLGFTEFGDGVLVLPRPAGALHRRGR